VKRTWILAGRSFPTSAAVERELRAILDRHADGDRLEGEEDALVRAVLEHHPHYAEKRGPGIAYVYVYAIRDTPWKRFNICRTGDSICDVGFSHCLENHDGRSPEQKARTQLARVCRQSISDQKERFKESRYESGEGWRCALCDDLVLYSGEAHVDHMTPWTFERLMADFFALEKLAAADVAIVASSAYQGHSQFADRDLGRRWQSYHATWAQLRILCKQCHGKVTRKQKRTKGETV
jgi:5-methylcytosine-specific restriction endonuclease McrA